MQAPAGSDRASSAAMRCVCSTLAESFGGTTGTGRIYQNIGGSSPGLELEPASRVSASEALPPVAIVQRAVIKRCRLRGHAVGEVTRLGKQLRRRQRLDVAVEEAEVAAALGPPL